MEEHKMKKILYFIFSLIILCLSGCKDEIKKTDDSFENYGMPEYTVTLSYYDISESGIYTSVEEVGAYLYTFEKLPSNYRKKSEFNRSDYTTYNKLSVGGDIFYNREELLPKEKNRVYYECDIDYQGGNRNAKRIVFSNDHLIFYTKDHYDSFSILRFVE